MNLRELSQILGLSQTTVSRALNGYPEVSEATRKRVEAAALTHGYRPNTRARSLATGRAMAIGHVVPLAASHEVMNPIFADFIAGAGEVYGRKGYDMLLSIVSESEQEKAYRDLRTKGSVDGIIVHAPRLGDSRIALLHEIGIPFVVHGRSSEEQAPYSWVDVNNTRAFRRATEYLLDLGHRRIALINGLENMDFARRRRAGYEQALSERAIAPDPGLMFAGEMTEGYGYATMRKLLATARPPSAVLVASMIPAIGVRHALSEAGLTMGREVSVITHDDDLGYFHDAADVPAFTTTLSSVREAGRLSASMLLDIISSPDPAPRNRLLEARLTIGRSTGPCQEVQS